MTMQGAPHSLLTMVIIWLQAFSAMSAGDECSRAWSLMGLLAGQE